MNSQFEKSTYDVEYIKSLFVRLHNGEEHIKDLILSIFQKSKFCNELGQPMLGRWYSKIHNASSVIQYEEIMSTYWLGWTVALFNNKNIGDPLAFLHAYGVWYIRTLYTKKLRDNIMIYCHDCGASKNIIIANNKVCFKCQSPNIQTYRYVQPLVTQTEETGEFVPNILAYEDSVYDTILAKAVLLKILSKLKPNTRAYDLLNKFIQGEIEIDTNWKKSIAEEWGVSEFRIVTAWRKIKEIAREIEAEDILTTQCINRQIT